MTHHTRDYFLAHQKVVDASIDALGTAAESAGRALVSALAAGNKVICFGNGGSSSQASHMAGELTGRFSKSRLPLPALSLSADSGTVTCISNDFGYDAVFERQVEALAQKGDIAIALSTSGKSANVIRALKAAKARDLTTIALTGSSGLTGADADHILAVPSDVTAHIQEVHLMLLHLWCVEIDKAFAPD
ncbi:MAG: SIS domain-containing protein [Gemmatimonadota bacterium]|nr:SIS domain-containing protein [Gemmatimonadota bacterium]